MATHSSVLAWEIPWTEETDGLQSMESQKSQIQLTKQQQQQQQQQEPNTIVKHSCTYHSTGKEIRLAIQKSTLCHL